MDHQPLTANLSASKLQGEVDRLAPWPTSIYLDKGVWTRHGVNMAKTSWYVDQLELLLGGFSGKRLLDIGSNTGYLTLEVALRGAHEVVSIEPHKINHERCHLVYQSRRLLGNKIQLRDDKMEDLTLERDGEFDGIFFCGTIYHLESPWKILNEFGRMTDTILVESRLARADKINNEHDGLEYYEFDEHGGDDRPLLRVDSGLTRHPTRKTLNELLVRAGFGMTWQIMPTSNLTQKYQDEECVAFVGKRRQYMKPLISVKYDQE